MKNIYYMVYSLESGGIERYSINLYKYIDKKKYNLDFVVWSEEKEFFDDIFYDMGGKKICLKKGTKGLRGIKKKVIIIKNCLKSLTNKKYDFAYFNISSPTSILKFPLLCKMLGMKVIIHSHNSNALNKKKSFLLSKFVMTLIVDKYLSCSVSAAEFMFPKRVYNSKKYELINNGIEAELYSFKYETRERMRKKLNINDDFVIGHIGRFNEQKNHFFLIDIFEKIYLLKKKSKLYLIGAGDLKEKIMDYVKTKQLEKQVFFVGTTQNISEYLHAFDVFVLPSLFEGLPVVGIEAQATGIRCIMSDQVTVDTDITGLIKFLPLTLSADNWANQIIKYGSNYIRRNTYREIQKAGYDIKSTARRVEEILDEL